MPQMQQIAMLAFVYLHVRSALALCPQRCSTILTRRLPIEVSAFASGLANDIAHGVVPEASVVTSHVSIQ